MKVGHHVHDPRSGLPDSVPIQIFYKSPYSLKARGSLDPGLFKNFKCPVFTHGTYVINLGGIISDKKMVELAGNIADDLDFLDSIPNGVGTVVHYKTGDHIIDNIRRLLKLLGRGRKSRLIIENVKGTTIGEMYVLQKEFPGRIGFCFDTCHLFISGYDLRDLDICRNVFDEIKRSFPDLMLIHFNDSASPRQDIHEEPGFGYIGNPKLGGNSRTFRLIMKIMKGTGVPLVSEINT